VTRLVVASAAAVLAGLAGFASPATAAPRVTQIDATFPERAFFLTLPSRTAVDGSRIRVRENGGRVSGLRVVPAAEDGGQARPVVLAIDASNSMRGRPIRGAMAAARALASQRTPTQPLGAIVFNSETAVLLPLTTNEAAIRRALANPPPLAQGTRLYDGAREAAAVLRDSGSQSGSIVLLSDGADTESEAAPADVRQAARETRAKIFSVGLRSRQFDAAALKDLAAGTGGRSYVASSVAALTPIYEQLGYELANEYVVRYRSFAGPKERVRVEISVPGVPGAARSGYVSPALPELPVPTFARSSWDSFWRSGWAGLVVALVCGVLLALALLAFVRPKNRLVRARISEFVSLSQAGRLESEAARLTEKVFTGTERSLERTRWWGRFKEELEIAEIRMPAVQIALWTVAITGVVLWLLWLVAGGPAVIFAFAVPLIVRSVIKAKLARRRAKFAEQLPDNLQVLASAMRAGHSLVGALSVVVDDAPEPSRSELQRGVADEQLGVPLEDAIREVGRRMDNRDLEQVALVAMLGRDTGGNTAEVLDRVTETVRERQELRRLVKVLTAQGRLSRWVVSIIPVFLLAFITVVNPDYVEPLYDRTAGRVVLVVAALMVITGSLVIRRIVNIKV
jgi:tight adherence protein B